MPNITIDLNKSIEENASLYFEKAKKLKKKIAGAEAIIEQTKRKIEREGRKKEAEIESEEIVPDRKKQWYEKFRWFISSEGFLVIGGRDATSNEIIIKKNAEKDDIVFHTDMAGSPFFLVKKDSINGKEIGESTINETANATCSFSRAWKLGMSTSDVFFVKPDQVTKEANAGEYISKGAFMIKGKTNYIKNEMDLAIGLFDGAVMAGPLNAIKTHCKKYIIVEQGSGKSSNAAKMVKKEVGGSIDEIIRALPSGGIKVAVEHENKRTKNKKRKISGKKSR